MNARTIALRLGLAVVAILLVLAIAIAGFIAYLHSGPGERMIAGMAEDALSDPNTSARIDGLSLTWPFVLSAEEVRVSDRSGPWLRLHEPLVDWSPSALLQGTVQIDRLTAREVVVHRQPEPPLADSVPAAEEDAAGGFPLSDFAYRLNEVSAPIVLEQPVIGERVELSLDGTFQMRGAGGEVDMRLRSAEGELARLTGTAGRDYLDLRWYLEVPRLQRWEKLAGTQAEGRVVASGSVAGRLPNPTVDGILQVGPGRLANVEWSSLETALSATPTDDGSWEGNARAGITDPVMDGEAIVPSAKLETGFKADTQAGNLHLTDTTLMAGDMSVSAEGKIGDWGKRSDLTVEAEFFRLGELTGMALEGGAAARAHVTGDLSAPDLNASIHVQASDFASGIGVLDRLLGPRPTIRADTHVGPDFQVRIDSGEIDGALASAQVAGEVGAVLDLTARLSVPDLSVFAETLAGAGIAEGRIAGGMDDLATWGTAQFERLAVAGSPPAHGTAGFDFRDLTGTPMGRVTADLTVEGNIPLVGSANLVAADNFRIENLYVQSRDSRLTGRLEVVEGGVGGALSATIPRLRQWRNQLGLDLAGSLEAQALLDPAAGQSLRLTARGQNLALGETRMAEAQVTATVQGIDDEPQGRVQLNARNVRQGGMLFDRVTATAQGDPAAFRFQAEGSGEQASLAALGSARVDGPRGLVALDNARLAVQNRTAELEGQTRILWGPDGVIVEPVALAVDGGRVEAEGRAVRGQLSGRAFLRGVPLDLVALAAPDVDAAGILDGEVFLGGTTDNPSARLTLEGRRIAIAAAARAGVDWLNGRLDAVWRDGRVQGDAGLWDGEGLSAQAEFSLPLQADGDPMPARAPISARIQMTGDVARLTEAVPMVGHVFEGSLDADIAIGGSMGRPQFTGRADLANGRYENLMQGTIIADLGARALFDLQSANISAQGTDGGRGIVRLDGALGLGGEAVTWQGDLSTRDFRLLRRDDIRATVDSDLTLAGQGGEGSLTGNAEVTSAEINIERLEGAGPVLLDVVEVNRAYAEAPHEPAPEPDGDLPMEIALGIDAQVSRAFVRGRGLDSEWGGALRVTGTLDDPSLGGTLSVQRGRFEFLGKVFQLSPESSVHFDPGTAGMDPRLDIIATTRARDVTAQVAVTGTPGAPQIDITSTPPLPQEEVLSRVLFDAESGQLSAFQQLQLGQMAASGLGAPGGGFDPVGGIRGMLGLDVLEVGVGEGEEGGPTVGIGRYIDEDTFLRLDQGTQGAGRVTVERELGRGFSVTTELGQEAGGGVGLEWRRDY